MAAPLWLEDILHDTSIRDLRLDSELDRVRLYEWLRQQQRWAAEQLDCCERCRTIKLLAAAGSAYRAVTEGE